MFHLIPEKDKKVLKHQYYYRLGAVAFMFLIASMVVASVFLFPSYIISEKRLSDIQSQDNQMKASIDQKTNPALGTFISTLSAKLSALSTPNQSASSTFYIKEITDAKISGISINDLSLTEGNQFTILVGGNADTRDSLTAYYRALEGLPDFSNVDLPISDFAQDKDIDFNITITVKK